MLALADAKVLPFKPRSKPIQSKSNVALPDDITVFGLTGGIACGKSFVSSLLQKHLIPVVDADVCAREVVGEGSLGLSQLVEAFGTDILDGVRLDRAKLGDMVFGKADQLRKLNAIMQPLIAEQAGYLLRLHLGLGCKIVCYDAALIIEVGQADAFRPLVVVVCEPEVQLARLIKRGLTEDQALARMASQISNDMRIEAADMVVDTNGSKDETQEQVEALVDGLTEGD